MRVIGFYLCGWLLPLLAFAEGAADVTLRLADGVYRAGDIVELHAEMRRTEYAEFELHVPAQQQLHFVAHTREPVRYVDGEYVQRAVLLLQPMTVGEYELTAIKATVTAGEQLVEQPLPPVHLIVESYAAEDTSKTLMDLGQPVEVTKPSGAQRWVKLLLVLLAWGAWRFLRTKTTPAVQPVAAQVGLDEVLEDLEDGHTGTALIEQVLARPDVMLSPDLRQRLEAAVYAGRSDSEDLIRHIRKEVQG